MRILTWTLLALTTVASLPETAPAQPTSQEGPGRRMLAGHQYQPLERVKDPFVTTHLRTATGAGIATGFESPFIGTEGDTLGVLEGDLAFFVLEFEYQKNLFGWGAIRVALSGSGRAGIDEESILADGLTTIYGTVIEGKARVYQSDRTQVAVQVAGIRKSVFGLDPFGFAQRIIDAGGLTKDNALVTSGNIHRIVGGASGAWTIRPWIGGVASADFGYAEPIQKDDDGLIVGKLGIGASADLAKLDKWPVGFTLGYDYDSFPEGGADVAKGIHSGTIGVNYTGREDFHFGFETQVSTLKQTDVESTLAAMKFVLNLRYYF